MLLHQLIKNKRLDMALLENMTLQELRLLFAGIVRSRSLPSSLRYLSICKVDL